MQDTVEARVPLTETVASESPQVAAPDEATAVSPILAVILLALVMIATLGRADFYTRGEAREALIVKAMATTGDWILPRGYNEAVPSKPPLFHWVGAAASKLVGGVNEETIRLPSALFSLFAMSFFLLALRSRFTARECFLFAAFLFLTFGWMRSSVSARVDMVHASCLACGILAGYFALETRRASWHAAAAVLCGLAVLSKGPVGIALPGAVLLLWSLYRRGQLLKNLISLAFIFCGAATVSLPWYIAAYSSAPEEFMARFWSENVARFASTMSDSPHEHSALYLFAMLFLETLPWSPLALLLLYRVIRRQRELGWPMLAGRGDDLVKFSALTAAAIILFYCIPSAKRGVYLLPAYPFLAILTIYALRTTALAANQRRMWRSVAGFTLAGFFLAQAVVIPSFVSRRASERALADMVDSAVNGEHRVFSYGYEFYGASFYSGRTFHRFEDVTAKRIGYTPQPGDILVVPEPELTRFRAANPDGLDAEVIGHSRVQARYVMVLRFTLTRA